MKTLTLIAHTNVQQKLTDLLRSIKQVSGFTFTHVEGHGVEIVKNGFLSARDEMVGYIPRTRTDLLLEDADVKSALGKVSDPQFDITSHCFYWVTPAQEGGHL
jgi:nitrogen regulatory protein P-II 1